jgi:hypothetical protein
MDKVKESCHKWRLAIFAGLALPVACFASVREAFARTEFLPSKPFGFESSSAVIA